VAAGSYGALPLAEGDQRAMGRKLFQRGGGRGGFSPGGFSDQDGEEAEWLRYLADVSRGVTPKPRATGFRGVRRR
jgi:hypothetical protein